jgi:hypothetical protein
LDAGRDASASDEPASLSEDQRPAFEVYLDALLAESLSRVQATDIRSNHASLVHAARSGIPSTGLFSPEELDAATQSAQRDIDLLPIAVPPIHISSIPGSRPTVSPSEHGRWAYLAIAASIIGTLLTISWFQRNPGNVELASGEPKNGMGSPAHAGRDNQPASTAQSNNVQASTAQPNRITQPSNENLASNASVSNAPAAQIAPSSTAIPPSIDSGTAPQRIARNEGTKGTTLEPKLPVSPQLVLGTNLDREITSVIDQQFEHLWKRLGIEALPSTDQERLENRLAMILVGRLPTNSERESIRQSSQDDHRGLSNIAKQWIESDEFDRHWGSLLTTYYLGGLPPSESESEARQAFQSWVEQSVRSNLSLGNIEREIIVASVPATKPVDGIVTNPSPAAHWMNHWIARRPAQTQTILASSSATPVGLSADQVSALDGLTLQTLRLAGRSDAACVRCHNDEGNARPIDPNRLASLQSLPPATATDPKLYASVASAFMRSVGSSKDDLYFTDAEQRMTVANHLLPDGKRLVSSDNAQTQLGDWFANSEIPRSAMVDFVWSQLLGQPLLPSAGLSAGEGLDERRDLVQFLAQKSQEHGQGLKPLVYWIAMSSPLFMREPLNDPNQYLKMDASTLARYENEKKTFARYAGVAPRREGRQPLEMLSDWIRPTSGSRIENPLLAQPSNGVNPSGRIGATTTEVTPWSQWSPARLAFEMSTQAPLVSLASLSEQLAASPLTDDQIIEHAFLIDQSRLPQAWEHQRIAEVFDPSEADRAKSTLRLLSALHWY